MAKIRPIVNATPDKQVMDDIGSTLTYLKAQKYADSNHVGITGFCWGGGVVWLACETYPQIKAGVAWYGRLAPAANAAPNPSQMWPAQKVKDLHAPVLGLYAGKDPLTDMVPEMRKQLAANNRYDSEIVIYPDAQHGFHADYRASYNEAATPRTAGIDCWCISPSTGCQRRRPWRRRRRKKDRDMYLRHMFLKARNQGLWRYVSPLAMGTRTSTDRQGFAGIGRAGGTRPRPKPGMTEIDFQLAVVRAFPLHQMPLF